MDDLREEARRCCEECPGNDTCEHAKVCVCGDCMEGHAEPMWCGHSPVSMHDYYSSHRRRTEPFTLTAEDRRMDGELETEIIRLRAENERLRALVREAANVFEHYHLPGHAGAYREAVSKLEGAKDD